MHKSQNGVALVEAVLAIVLLAIVGVTIVGQFGDSPYGSATAMQGSVDARTSSAAAINFTARVLDPVAFASMDAGYDCETGDDYSAVAADYEYPGFITTDGTNCR